MSELNQLIEAHGAEVARYERDFNNMGSAKVKRYPYQQLFNISSDPRPIITVGALSTDSYGRINEQLQEGMIGEINPEAHHVQFHEQVFGGTIRISLSAMRNRQQFSSILADEMDSLQSTVNKNVMGLFGNAFSSSHNGWDGKPLCDDAHPLADGTTQDNKETAALSQSSAETVYGKMAAIKNISGVPTGRTVDTFLVPTGLMVAALKVTGSQFVTGSNNNDINVNRGIRVVVGPTLSDSNNWFAINDRGMRSNLKLFFQEPFRIMLNEAIIDSLYIRIPTRVVLSWGFINHDWIIGSSV